jgi:hypothetical protein
MFAQEANETLSQQGMVVDDQNPYPLPATRHPPSLARHQKKPFLR